MINNIFIISGPSGAGEDSIIKGLKKELDIEVIKTTSTRRMRSGESQGNPYYFISRDKFKEKIEKGDFLEYAKEYNDNYYGVTKEELERVNSSGKIGIWKIEYKGVMTAKKIFPNIVAIFINAPDLSTLAQRIRKRGGVSENFIKERIDYTKEWLKYIDIYDYIVINKQDKLAEAIKEVKHIILNRLNADKLDKSVKI